MLPPIVTMLQVMQYYGTEKAIYLKGVRTIERIRLPRHPQFTGTVPGSACMATGGVSQHRLLSASYASPSCFSLFLFLLLLRRCTDAALPNQGDPTFRVRHDVGKGYSSCLFVSAKRL